MSLRTVRAIVCAGSLFIVAATASAQSADLFANKTGPGTAAAGSDVTYTITIGNVGPDDASGAQMNDDVPAGMTFVSVVQTSGTTFTCSTPSVGGTGSVTCDLATFTAGSTASFDITFNIPVATAPGTTFINTATAASDTPDDTSENNSSIAGTTVSGGNLADVSIDKTGPGSAPANSDVTYTITLTNNGPNDATTVSFTDTLPSGTPPSPMTFVSFLQTSGPAFNCGVPSTTTTCSIATFPLGSTATFNFTGHIPNGTGAGTTYTNKATLTSDNDPTSENDIGSAVTTVSSADVGVTKTGPATAVAGGPTYDYIITLSNSGPDSAIDASFTDVLPAGLAFVSIVQDTGPAASCGGGPTVACTIAVLGNGTSAQFTLTVQPAATIANGTIISNTATASTSSSDPNASNDSQTAMTTVSAQADVSIVKSAPATAVAGNNITYAITVTNNGPSTASSVQWTDTLPASTTFVSNTQTGGPTFTCSGTTTQSCSIASLAPGATATFNLVVTIASSTPNGSTISNTANVSTTTNDLNPGNNGSTAMTNVSTSADVGVTKTAAAAVTAGSNLTYTITVGNIGPSDAANVVMNDILPAGTTFVSENQTTGPAFTCTTGATVNCSIASLTAGASATFSIVVNVPAATPNGTTISNTATVATSTSDPAPGNNTSTAMTTVAANADLSVTKNAPPIAPSGGPATWTVTVANAGPSPAINVTLTDVVPANTHFASASQTSGPAFTCTTPPAGGTGTISCTIASFASGASATFQFNFTTDQGTPVGTTISNTANVSSITTDPNPANNSSTATVLSGASIPALSSFGLTLLGFALAVAAVVAMRR